MGMNFSDALANIKTGAKLTRSGWNGADQFVFLVPGSTFAVSRAPLLGIYPEGTVINYAPHIDIKKVDGSISVWAPSMGDLMCEDWYFV
jgi:hypothetical protein